MVTAKEMKETAYDIINVVKGFSRRKAREPISQQQDETAPKNSL